MERDILSAYNIVYDSLVTIDDNYYPQGCLAESWEVSSNGKTWTFHLRQDVVFSDGAPLTARDVVASANYILAKAQDEYITDHGFYANLKYFVSSITAKDDYTVIIKAKRPSYGLLYEMTFPVVPEAFVDSDNPPGSGPYVITEFHAGERMWLAANPKWWKAKQPQVKEILFMFHDTSRALIDNYEFAQVDAAFTRSIAGTQFKTGTSSLVMSYRTNQLECLYMNHNSSEMTYEVRKAIRFLIDKSKIISNAYSGLAVATNLPFFPGTWMYNDSLDPLFARNVDEAKKLLAEAGWEDSDENGILDYTDGQGDLHNLHLSFYYYEEPDNDVRAEAVDIITAELAEVGISCTVTALNMTDMQARLKGKWDMALVSFAMDPCPDPGFMLMSGNTGNYCRYKSSRMNELCEELRKQVAPENYRQVLMQIQAQFEQDCPFVCLYWRLGNVLSRFMYTTCRDVREYELLRGIDSFVSN